METRQGLAFTMDDKLHTRTLPRVFGLLSKLGRELLQVSLRVPLFTRNLIVGVLVAVFLYLGPETSRLRDMEDFAVDWMNRMQVDTEWLNPPDTRGYVLLDMDERSFEAWGEPFHVPRDHLARMIHYAADGGALAVVVDVELNRPGTDPAADRVLLDLISRYPHGAPDLILLRTTSSSSKGRSKALQWRRTIVDQLQLSEAVHFAHSRYVKDDSDLRLRRWRLAEYGCLNGNPVVLPSVQLVLDVLLRTGREGWKGVQARLEAMGVDDCSDNADRVGIRTEPKMLRYADRLIRLSTHGIDQRVVYSFSDSAPGGKAPFGLERISAVQLLKHLPDASFDPVRDRIVVIGASYEDSRDLHETPVGRMPGALIVLNAVKSLNQLGQLEGPPTRVVLLIEVVLILVMAFLFSRFETGWAAMFTGTLIIVLLVPISFWWFRYGVWVDLAAPLLAMQLHQAFANWQQEHSGVLGCPSSKQVLSEKE
jgi:CHASE2 domain-containing sensor protein